MKKLVTALILLLLAGAGVYAYYKYGKSDDKPTVMTALVSRGPITEVVKATGTLEALRTVQVGSQVSGVVQKLYVDYNSVVHEGMVIAELDPSLLQMQVDVQTSNIERQKTDIESTKIQLDNDKINAARAQAQFDAKLLSQSDLEKAKLQVATRQATLDSSQKQLVQLETNLKQAQLNVSYCTIRSPIDGVVVTRSVDQGQTVQASMTTPQFFTLATDLTTLRLTGGVDEADIGKIRPGQDVTFTVDAYPNQTFAGKVDRVRLNATSQQNVVTYQVVANVVNNDLKLRPSMTAQLSIVIETNPDVIKIPNQALRFKPTTDMYTALGVTPPQPGAGRGMNGDNASRQGGGQGGPAGGQGGPQQQGQMAQAQPGQGQPAQGGQGQGNQGQGGQGQGGQNRRQGQGGGRGFGQGANLTPEERQKLAEQFGAGGGRGGGRGGRGRGQQPANATTTPIIPITERNADKIDDLFAPLQRIDGPGTVYTWDEANKQLKRIGLRVGMTDGQMTELVSGDLQPGQQLVTGVIIPVSMRPNTTGNPLMGPQRGGGPQPGGGGGGRGPGGGGGGRGGN